MPDGAAIQITLIFVNAGIGAFMLLIAFTLKRLVANLDKNTAETEAIAKTIGEMNTNIARFYVHKTDFDAEAARNLRFHEQMQEKHEKMQRELGNIEGQLTHSVKRKDI